MLQEQLIRYVQNTRQIRILSRPDPEKLDSENAYSEVLRANFIRIGEIAQENRAILCDVLDLLLDADRLPSDDILNELNLFSENLLNANSIQSLDIPLSHMISTLLFELALKEDDPKKILLQADFAITSSYAMINLIKRLGFGSEAFNSYRELGFRAADCIKRFTDRDMLASLDDEVMRCLVLINTRFVTCLYEGSGRDPVCCRQNLELLLQSSAAAQDEKIRALVPHYDWRYHQFRIMEYIGALCEHNNSRGCTLDMRRRISDICDRMLETWDSDPEYYKNVSPRIYVKLENMKCRFLSGRMDRDRYLEELVLVYRECDKEHASFRAAEEVHYIIGIPLEYLYALERPSGYVTPDSDHVANGPAQPLTDEQIETLTYFYHVIEKRAMYTIGTGSLSFMLEFLSMLLMHFIEVPEVTFSGFCLSLMRALHPPTYVHTLMVGEISQCLCRHLIALDPGRLKGACGYQTIEQVRSHEEEILTYIRDASLCHDFGKIPLIDIIFVYGRNLFDFEFDLIREHPDLGSRMLDRIPAIRKYQDIARGHHKWNDDSAGYPDSFSLRESADRPLIDIVTVADCMDAATDTIGRSYNRGKTLDEYIKEVEEGSGTRYAAGIAGLLRNPEVHAELEMILGRRREDFYKKTYQMLVKGQYSEST